MKTREQIELKFKNLCNIFEAYEERFSRLLDANDKLGLEQLSNDYYELLFNFRTLYSDCQEAHLLFDFVDDIYDMTECIYSSMTACSEAIDCIIEAKHEKYFSEMC